MIRHITMIRDLSTTFTMGGRDTTLDVIYFGWLSGDAAYKIKTLQR